VQEAGCDTRGRVGISRLGLRRRGAVFLWVGHGGPAKLGLGGQAARDQAGKPGTRPGREDRVGGCRGDSRIGWSLTTEQRRVGARRGRVTRTGCLAAGARGLAAPLESCRDTEMSRTAVQRRGSGVWTRDEVFSRIGVLRRGGTDAKNRAHAGACDARSGLEVDAWAPRADEGRRKAAISRGEPSTRR
jgi:hypothetical protein